jgi:molybdopterin-guanine dinucleotide biosynthesis protein A
MSGHTQSGLEAPASIIILAGGQSQRLGRDKSLLPVGGEPLLARTVRRLAPLSDDLIVVTNHPNRYEPLGLPVRLIPDERRGVGSLMGIYSGLRAARHGLALAVGCDMPFLNVALLRYMLGLAPGYDVVIPRLEGFVEPLHAVYSQACQAPMERLLAAGRRQIIAFFGQVQVRHVEEDEIDRFDPQRLSFVNVNTPENWAEVQAIFESRGL